MVKFFITLFLAFSLYISLSSSSPSKVSIVSAYALSSPLGTSIQVSPFSDILFTPQPEMMSHSPDISLFLILYPPKEVPYPKEWLTQSLSRKILHESYIPVYPLEIMPKLRFPNRFRASYLPKFPASSTSFCTNLPYFSFGGTISREAGMPKTSCMIYMIPPANFHNPNSFNFFCTLSLINNKSSLINT